MTINIEDLKKKIIYRSTYRGTKEMDKLLSSFTETYIGSLTEPDLINLSDLIDIDDENLYNFKMGKAISINIDKNKVTDLFKRFVYKKR